MAAAGAVRLLGPQPGAEGSWYEYVPASYDSTAEVPLVLSFHAGHYFAAAQVFDTCWCEIAEREGFIVAFPEAGERGCFGSSDETRKIDPGHPDVAFALALVDDLQRRYRIDPSRVYLHGMSRGGVFATELAYLFGQKFAGCASSCGLTMSDVLEPLEADGDLAPMLVLQMRGAFDAIVPYRERDLTELVARNRAFWKRLNGCGDVPQLSIGSRKLVARWQGERADLVFRESAFHNHYEAISDAEDAWSLFRTVRRAPDGTVERIAEPDAFEPDRGAIAVGDMRSKALIDGEVQPVGAMVRQFRDVNVRRRGGFQNPLWSEAVEGKLDGKDMHVYYYAPVGFVARVFGLEWTPEADRAAVKAPDGAEVRFTRGSSAAVVHGRVRNMGQAAREVDGRLCITIDWFAEYVMGLCTAACDGVLYIADHQVVMTGTFAGIIREAIGWGA